MQVTRANFGEYVSISPAKPDTATFWSDSKYWFIEDGREATYADSAYDTPKSGRGPFERADFGDRDRFSWPAGACAIAHAVQPIYWADRFAIWVEAGALVILDATRPLMVRFAIAQVIDPSSYRPMMLHGGKLWIMGDREVVWFALAELEALFEREPGEVPLEIAERYPRRRRERSVTARVDAIGESEVRAYIRTTARNVTFPRMPGLALQMEVTLTDEQVADVFLEVALPGQPSRPVRAPFPTAATATATLAIESVVDPAGELARPAEATGMRQGDLDRLFAARVDDPDDDATRFVIVDLLEAAGESYAPKLQALLADGKPGDHKAALGTLASYITKLEYRGGLPWAGTLSTTAPLDDDIGDIVAADQRLGLFHTLRIGDGNYNLYAKLVAAPRAVGLRHVDVPRVSVATALIAARRRDLARLSGVKFATREMNDSLADSTFDRVREIETETAIAVVDKLLDFVSRDEMKFFSRAPRCLILRERARRDEVLVASVLAAWDRLPLDKVTVAGITLGRDGVAHVTAEAAEWVVGQVRAKFEVEA